MTPIISIVGWSNSGKTTYLEKLIRELKARGWRVGIIKHHHTDQVEIDQPGKDTWRHAQAGADVVAIASPAKVAVIEKLEKELALEEVAGRINNVDVIITEGYKYGNKPKIEVFRSAVHSQLISPPEELIAIVTDVKFDKGVPCFDLDDTKGVAELIEEKFLK